MKHRRPITEQRKQRQLAAHPGKHFKQMRLLKGISPRKAAEFLEVSLSTLKRFEKRQALWPEERVNRLLRWYGYSKKDFRDIIDGKMVLPEIHPRAKYQVPKDPNTDSRKYKKEISKECRVLKTMRGLAKLTQPQAAERCGWHRSSIDHRENGRTNLTRKDIEVPVVNILIPWMTDFYIESNRQINAK